MNLKIINTWAGTLTSCVQQIIFISSECTFHRLETKIQYTS